MTKVQTLKFSFIHSLRDQPRLGLLDLDTDGGRVALNIDKASAQDLLEQIVVFLGAKIGDRQIKENHPEPPET